jgi:hypothetical protein
MKTTQAIAEHLPLEPGQVRRDPDPRTEAKRTVTVEKVDGRFAYVLSSAGRRSRIAARALQRWPLVAL